MGRFETCVSIQPNGGKLLPIRSCLIIAAGKGTRLKGFGDLKPLANLCGRPLIEHAMLRAAEAGVTRFVIVTGYKAAILNRFLISLRRKYRWKIKVVENPEYEKANGLSVLAAESHFKSDFFLSMCDHVVEPQIYEALKSAELPQGTVGLGVDLRLQNKDVDLKDVTRVFVENGIIRKIGKDLRQYNAFDCGIFRAGPAFFAAIRESISRTGDYSISGSMKVLAKSHKALAIDIGNARWMDVDSPPVHKKAHKWMRELRDGKLNGHAVNIDCKIVAVGHRGTKKFAPENTIAAHEAAFALGARCIEFDIRCTKDGHFVLMHDGTVNRTTNGFGRVEKMTLEKIKTLDAGSHRGSEFRGEPVPTLREALRNVRGRFAVDLDFKGGPMNSAEILANVLEEEGFSSSQLVTIFARWYHFGRLKSLCPQYALRPHYISARRTRRLAREMPLEIMGLRRLSFSFKAVKAIRNADFHLFCNTMGLSDNERGFSDSIEAGAMFIQTDHLDRLIPYLEERGLLEYRVPGRDYQPIIFDPEALPVS